MNQSTCNTCGKEAPGSRMYCSRACTDIAKKRPCTVCGEPAWTTPGIAQPTHKKCMVSEHGTTGRYASGCRCSECKAKVAANQRAYMARVSSDPSRQGSCLYPVCPRPAVSKGRCAKHYRAWQKKQGLWKPSPSDHWTNPKKMARALERKAIQRGATGETERFTVTDLAAISTTCGLCGITVDMSLTYPEPMSPSIDHITPLSKGGTHQLSNAQLTHLRCNIQKGAKVESNTRSNVR